MKRISLILAVCLFVSLIASGCSLFEAPASQAPVPSETAPETSASPSPSETPPQETTPEPEPEPTPDPQIIGDYRVEITKAEPVKDYKKKKALRVYFTFKNNGDEPISFIVAVNSNAYQDGKELKNASIEKPTATDENTIRQADPYEMMTCSKIFSLNSKSKSPVVVEVTEFFAYGPDSKKITATFEVE